ncbi:MAG: 4-hydroxy-tetrahydrodipicolinate reductase [Methanotrichaceae archaeon]
MNTKVAITGVRGRMGKMIVDELALVPDLMLVAGFDPEGVGEPIDGVTITDAAHLTDTLAAIRPDVLIDFTTASAVVENVRAATDLGINLVVGTTGISDQDLDTMKSLIDGRAAAVISPNFSVGVNVFWNIIEVAARALQGYDVEVIEAHHRGKMDAPSGTAEAAVDILTKAIEVDRDSVVYGREKGTRLRGEEIGVHALRAGDIVGDHTVLFAGPGERLEIRHQAHSRQAFASGAVRAARWVVGRPPGIYSMKDVLIQKKP